MTVSIRFTKNAGPRVAPDSKVYGPFANIKVHEDDENVPTITCTKENGETIDLAWRDYGGWYCDYDGDVYRAFEIHVAAGA